MAKKAILKFETAEKNDASTSALVSISVGEPYHEGEELEALLRAVQKKFTSVSVMVVDTLQRFTLAMKENLSPENLILKSRSLGDTWIQRNQTYLKKYNLFHRILRWDDWLETKGHLNNLKLLEQLQRLNPSFEKALFETSEFFLQRFFKKYPERLSQITEMKTLCLRYLMEEAAIMPLWVTKEFHYEVYPKRRNGALRGAYELLVQPYYPHLLKPVYVKFKKVKVMETPRKMELSN